MQPWRICHFSVLITTVLCLQEYEIGPDEDIPDTRKPVTAGTCRCSACNSTDSAFQHGDRENAAFMKPATQSSVYIEGGQTSSDACGAVSGITGPEYKARQSASPSCVRTHPADLTPWLSVDLLYVYSFQELILFLEQSSSGSETMASMDVLVDGRLCYSYPHDIAKKGIPLRSKVTCEQTMTGRYIRLHKRRPEMMGVEPKQGSQYRYLSLCQLQLWVCKLGTYGASVQSCQECSKTCKYTCDNYYGCDHRALHDVGINKAVEVSSLQWGDGSYINDMFQTPHDSSHCVKTRDTPWPSRHWVRIDLGATYMVYYLTVQARVDCCSENELREFYVSVADNKSQAMLYPPGVNQQCMYRKEAVPIRLTANLTCAKPKAGRFVTLIKKNTTGLSVCEVGIFGHLQRTLKLGEVCMPGSPAAVCGSRQRCENGRCRHKVLDYCRRDEDCTPGTACDRGHCRGQVNYACTIQDECVFQLTCENATRMCKIPSSSGRTCSATSDCVSNLICDRDSFCRVKVGDGCRWNSLCVSGAFCRTTDVCACYLSHNERSGDRCNPKPGLTGANCSVDKDCRNGDCINSVCTCRKGTSSKGNILHQCRGNALEPCNNPSECVSNSCDSNQKKCIIPRGRTCHGKNTGCSSQTTCDAGVCKSSSGQVCQTERLCATGSVCREFRKSRWCLMYTGEDCSGSRHSFCMDGVCSTEDSKCGRPVGQNCSLEQGRPPPRCVFGALCGVDNICKADLGGECGDDAHCRPGLVCNEKPDRTYSLRRKCRNTLGRPCRDNKDCVKGSSCDHLKHCKISETGDCRNQTNMCVAGGKCIDGKCSCKRSFTNEYSDNCRGISGIVTGDCKDERPKCEDTLADCVGGTCQCGASFVPDPEDLTCRRKDRFPCSQNYSIPCSRGAVCDRGVCVLQTGQRCRGDMRKGRCQTVSVCDVDGHCRVNINQSCTDQPTNCRNGSVCDLQQDLCKVKPGEHCTSYGDCVAGSTCDQRHTCQCAVGISFLNETSHTCVPEAGRVGGECINSSDTDSLTCNATFTECNISTSQCQCQPGFSPDHVDFSCKKKPGGLCTDDAECFHGSICIAGTCSVPLGGHCEQNGDCIGSSVCDSEALCKIDIHGNCSGSRQDFCRMGTVCDWLHQCHRAVGDTCNLTVTAEGNVHSCVAGANCQDSVCTCDPEVTSDYGAVCKPHAGRFGSSCRTDEECSMPGTVCVNNMCVCDGGHSPDREFGCGGNEDDGNETESDASSGNKGIIAGIAVGCIVVAASVSLLIYRKMSHRRQESKSKRRQSEDTDRSRDEEDVITTEPRAQAETAGEGTEMSHSRTGESTVDLDVSESETS